MNKIFLLFTFSFFYSTIYANDFNQDKFYRLGLIFGVLKYHETEISNGKTDWNNKCLQIINEVEQIYNVEDFEIYILNLLKTCQYEIETKQDLNIDYQYLNFNIDWIDKELKNEKIKIELKNLFKNKNIGDHYAKVRGLNSSLNFDNEKKLENFDYKQLSHRLLFLYNYWNVINYWNVNKFAFKQKWDSVLKEKINEFIHIKNLEDFENSKMSLITKINDTHAYYLSEYIFKTNYIYNTPFAVKNINDSLVVNYVYDKEKCDKMDIKVGDVITKIKGQNINDLIEKEISNKISSSNTTSNRLWSHYLLYNKIDSLEVEIVKQKGKVVNKYIKLFHTLDYKDSYGVSFYNNDKVKIYNSDIAYINLENITKKEFNNVFKENKNLKSIILDLRNYPKNINEQNICDVLLPNKTTFLKTLTAINKKPGISTFNHSNLTMKLIKPFEVGFKNENNFKGKIVLLVDRKTQSNAEFIAMAIQSSANCITIGEQTGGAVMNITNFEMLDGTVTTFTGQCAYYPNGEMVHGKGVKIDVKLQPTTNDINPKFYINKALEILNAKFD